MSLAEFNLNTLRLARGAMRQTEPPCSRQQSILRILSDCAWLSVPQIAARFEMSANSLSGTINAMYGKGLIDRIGDRGDYRYAISAKGRVACG